MLHAWPAAALITLVSRYSTLKLSVPRQRVLSRDSPALLLVVVKALDRPRDLFYSSSQRLLRTYAYISAGDTTRCSRCLRQPYGVTPRGL